MTAWIGVSQSVSHVSRVSRRSSHIHIHKLNTTHQLEDAARRADDDVGLLVPVEHVDVLLDGHAAVEHRHAHCLLDAWVARTQGPVGQRCRMVRWAKGQAHSTRTQRPPSKIKIDDSPWGRYFPKRAYSLEIWKASSRVCPITITGMVWYGWMKNAVSGWLSGSFSQSVSHRHLPQRQAGTHAPEGHSSSLGSRRWRVERTKTAVLPMPDLAWQMMSMPSSACGMHSCCTAERRGDDEVEWWWWCGEVWMGGVKTGGISAGGSGHALEGGGALC